MSCCGSCQEGGACEGGKRASARVADRRGRLRPRPAAYSVGRSQPNNEIADLDASAERLRADLRGYSPPSCASLTGPELERCANEVSNWSALTHKANGWILRWGQFKTDLQSDYWWGDDDEVRLAGLKTEYNTIRQEVDDYTDVPVTAPPVDPAPPALDPAPPATGAERALYGILAVGLLGAAGYAAFKIVPLFIPVLSTAVSAAVAAKSR